LSISAYTGLPGSGKSYSVVKYVVLPALREGRTVFTNIPMNTAELEREGLSVPVFFDVRDLVDDPTWFQTVFEPGALFVFDEVYKLWPSGLLANKAQEGHKSFLAEHRHMVGQNGKSTEIALVTQDLAQISSFARALVETTFRTTKLSKVGGSGRFRVDVYSGAVVGQPNIKKRDREEYGKYSSDVWRFYKSHTQAVDGQVGDETRTDKRFSIFGSLGIKLAFLLVPIMVLVCWFAFSAVASFFGMADEPVDPVVSETSSPAKPVARKPEYETPLAALLARADVTISFNMGRYPEIAYIFSVLDRNRGRVALSAETLLTHGFRIRPIDNCLAQVVGHGLERFVMCPEHDKPSLVQSMIPGVSDSAVP